MSLERRRLKRELVVYLKKKCKIAIKGKVKRITGIIVSEGWDMISEDGRPRIVLEDGKKIVKEDIETITYLEEAQ